MGRILKQTNVFDAFDGSLLQTSTKYQQSMFGNGWIMINKRTREIFKRVDSAAQRVFFYLLLKQTYQPTLYVSADNIAEVVGLNVSTAYKALRQLEKTGYLQRLKVDGVRAILLNPGLTACGKSSLVERRKTWAAQNLIDGVDNEEEMVYDTDNQEGVPEEVLPSDGAGGQGANG